MSNIRERAISNQSHEDLPQHLLWWVISIVLSNYRLEYWWQRCAHFPDKISELKTCRKPYWNHSVLIVVSVFWERARLIEPCAQWFRKNPEPWYNQRSRRSLVDHVWISDHENLSIIFWNQCEFHWIRFLSNLH